MSHKPGANLFIHSSFSFPGAKLREVRLGHARQDGTRDIDASPVKWKT